MWATAAAVLAMAAPVDASSLAAEAEADFEARDFAAARDKLRQAYALDPDPRFVYGQAQALRYGGNCRTAIELYERVITLDASVNAKSDARAGIEDCNVDLDAIARATAAQDDGRFDEARRILAELGAEPASPEVYVARANVELAAGDCDAAEAAADAHDARAPSNEAGPPLRDRVRECREPPPSPTPPPPTIERPPATPTDAPPSKRWIADPAGGVLVALGIPTLAVGGSLMGVARSRFGDANTIRDEREYERITLQAGRLNAAGIALLAVGGALIVGGVIRYAVVGARARRDSARK